MRNAVVPARRSALARSPIWFAVAVALLLLSVALAAEAQAPARPLLVMVSLDGLRPDYVTAADTYGAKIPNLRRFLKEGGTPRASSA